MTVGACSAVVGNLEKCVNKGRTQPRGRRMACRARSRVTGSDVIRHRPAKCRGALPGGGVATVASGRHRGVVVIHVARRAGYGRMRTGQREGRSVVIET